MLCPLLQEKWFLLGVLSKKLPRIPFSRINCKRNMHRLKSDGCLAFWTLASNLIAHPAPRLWRGFYLRVWLCLGPRLDAILHISPPRLRVFEPLRVALFMGASAHWFGRISTVHQRVWQWVGRVLRGKLLRVSTKVDSVCTWDVRVCTALWCAFWRVHSADESWSANLWKIIIN